MSLRSSNKDTDDPEKRDLMKRLTAATNDASAWESAYKLQKNQLKSMTDKRDEAEKKIRKLETKIQESKDEVQEHKEYRNRVATDLSNERTEKTRWYNDCVILRENAKTLRSQVGILQREKERLQDEHQTDLTLVKRLQAEIASQEEIVTSVAVAALAKLAPSSSGEISDDLIQEKFGELFGELRDWVEDTSYNDIARKEEVHEHLVQDGLLVSNQDLSEHEQFDMGGDTAADSILQTLLLKEICDQFLRDPYFITKTRKTDGSLSDSISAMLPQIESRIASRKLGIRNALFALTFTAQLMCPVQ